MKKVKILESFHVAATGVTYNKGEDVEVSEELAKRHNGIRVKVLSEVKEEKSNLDNKK